MADFSGRPLLDTRRDRTLFVDRESEVQRLKEAVARGYNTLVLGRRGSGKSSLLMHLRDDLRGGDRPVIVISGTVPDDAKQFLILLRGLLDGHGAADQDPPALRDSGDAPRTLIQLIYDVQRRAQKVEPKPIVLVDGLAEPETAHDLFGRLRDELWRLSFLWVVFAEEDLRAAFEEPPADAFFDETIELGALDDEAARRILAVRDPDLELDEQTRDAIVEVAGGSPRRVLALARQVHGGKSLEAIKEEAGLADRAGKLGVAARRLVEELLDFGPASASDEDLLRRVGWSRMRAQQVFSELEAAGFVESLTQRSSGPGRPRKVYGLRRGEATGA